MDQSKQYPASRKKLLKSRKEGDVAKSPMVAQLAGMVAVFSILVHREAESGKLFGYFEQSFGALADFQSNNMLLCVSAFFELLIGIVIPTLLAAVTAGIVAEIFQVGFYFLPGQLSFRLSRLDPVSGFRRIIGFEGQDSSIGSAFRRCAFGTFKSAVLGVGIPVISFVSVSGVFSWRGSSDVTSILVIPFSLCTVDELIRIIAICSVRLVGSVACFLTLVVSYDLIVQRQKRAKRLRMSAEELKREMRENEGDPEIQAQRKQIREEMAFNELVEGVRRAAVVVVNS